MKLNFIFLSFYVYFCGRDINRTAERIELKIWNIAASVRFALKSYARLWQNYLRKRNSFAIKKLFLKLFLNTVHFCYFLCDNVYYKLHHTSNLGKRDMVVFFNKSHPLLKIQCKERFTFLGFVWTYFIKKHNINSGNNLLVFDHN